MTVNGWYGLPDEEDELEQFFESELQKQDNLIKDSSQYYCPICSDRGKPIKMMIKSVRDIKDRHVLRQFWGCANFPDCRYTVSDKMQYRMLTYVDINSWDDEFTQELINNAKKKNSRLSHTREVRQPIVQKIDISDELKSLRAAFEKNLKWMDHNNSVLNNRIRQLEEENNQLRKRLDEHDARWRKREFEVF